MLFDFYKVTLGMETLFKKAGEHFLSKAWFVSHKFEYCMQA